MAVLSHEDLLSQVRKFVGDRTDDESVELIENVSDTLNAVNESVTPEEVDRRVAEAEEKWRRKYIDRFTERHDSNEEETHEEYEKITLEDVF